MTSTFTIDSFCTTNDSTCFPKSGKDPWNPIRKKQPGQFGSARIRISVPCNVLVLHSNESLVSPENAAGRTGLHTSAGYV